MARSLLTILITLLAHNTFASEARVLCYDRFENEIWEMTGEHYDDKTCKAMMVAGTVGVCFEGEAQDVVEMINDGMFEYSPYQKLNAGTATEINDNVVTFASYEGDFVPWTRPDVEMFRCPEFDDIKKETTRLADELDSSTDYAVSRRYREEFGLPSYLK